jgi:hypothetical protein
VKLRIEKKRFINRQVSSFGGCIGLTGVGVGRKNRSMNPHATRNEVRRQELISRSRHTDPLSWGP